MKSVVQLQRKSRCCAVGLRTHHANNAVTGYRANCARRVRRPAAQRCDTPLLAALLFVLAAHSVTAAEAPSPDRMAVDIIVSGRTSTARNIETAACGSTIPKTFSGDAVKNTPGFSWWVSKHWALKTDYPEEKARFYLTLLEQAYPHYVELFGHEIPGIGEKRLPVCYASSKKRLQEAMKSDGATWDFDGGGITLEKWKCAYQYPSGTLDYHQRYILLHECTHLYQMCLLGSSYTVPAWYTEGVADGLASHVYDPQARRLTMWVLDKATTRNPFDSGLAALRQSATTAEMIHDTKGNERGLAFLLAHYLMDDPDRAQNLRIWRDEMFPQNLIERNLTESSRLMQALFGHWRKINEDFQAWTGALHNTFHYAEWGWEQDGDQIWSYGFAEGGRLSETDINLPPRDTPAYDPFRMDYPLHEMSPLVGPVERGTAEPSVGCLIDFTRTPGEGRAGLGLGVIAGEEAAAPKNAKPNPDAPQVKSGIKVFTINTGRASGSGYLAILINQEKELVVEGAPLRLDRKVIPLPLALRNAITGGGHTVGMTVRIAAAGLEITLRARDPKASAAAEYKHAVQLTPEQRERVMSRPGAILSRDGRHGVTPYFDDRRRPEPDLMIPAPPNRWRNPGDKPLAALYRASWLLADKTPPSLAALKEAMLAAAAKDPEAQQAAVAQFQKEVTAVLADVERSGAKAEVAAKAKAALQDAAK